MKPIRLELKARNNRMISLREELGMTVKIASSKIGVDLGQYYRMEAPGFNPIHGVTGDLRPCARKVCEFYGVEPDFLWPDLLRRMKKFKVSREADFDEIERLVSPIELDLLPAEADHPERRIELEDLLVRAELSRREVLILKAIHLEGQTLDSVATAWGLSRERIRQLNLRALKKCRDASSRGGDSAGLPHLREPDSDDEPVAILKRAEDGVHEPE